ncbi:MAG: radical SAM protein [Lentimicrobium sp.]|nr:radical SAM protein [Lentimicrobium sp.]
MENIIFGPVPSRRLGKSIGINNIPHKVCSYSCAYCQVGKADIMQVNRQEFYLPDIIVRQLEYKLNCLSQSDFPDYITLVPDGEPTLDIHLGELILKLKSFGLPVAVITNSSLLSQTEVQSELMNADYISLKVDTVNQTSWRKVNKPHKDLNHSIILQSIRDFSQTFKGTLVTESMLLKDINDSDEELERLAIFLCDVKPEIAYIAIPTRPLAFGGIFPADEAAVAMAYETFTRYKLNAELLTGYEGNAFASSGNFADDILSITAVHPMRKDAVMELMTKSNATELILNQLIENELIEKVTFNNQDYFLRKFNSD